MKKFRLQSKNIGLTFSRCPLKKEEILEHLQSKIQIDEYYIVQETHKEPLRDENDTPYHIHAWISTVNKPNIQSCTFFDIGAKGEPGYYHPNVKKAKKNWVWNYLKKQDKKPLTNIPDNFVSLATDGKFDEALAQFIERYPKDYTLYMDKVKKNLRRMGQKERKAKIYPLVSDWDPDVDLTEKSLWLIGKSGTGKTEWAKSWCHSKGLTFLRITHLDKLKKYNGQDVLLFDDVSFKHLPRTTAIHIAETKNERDIHCRHAVAHIPAGVFNIFLSNDDKIWPRDPHGAIERRLEKRAPEIKFF